MKLTAKMLAAMEKCIFIRVFAVLSLTLFVNAAPGSIRSENLVQFTETPVRYDGAQLWSVSISNDQTRNVINKLNQQLGTYVIGEKVEHHRNNMFSCVFT